MLYPPEHVRFATTLPYFSEPSFAARATYLWPSYNAYKTGKLSFELHNLFSILVSVFRQDLLVIDSTPKSSLAACCLLALTPRRLHGRIILHGEMWAPSRGLLKKLEKVAIRCADRAIDRYIVISSDELTFFPRLWGVAANKMSFLPYFSTLKEDDVKETIADGDYVFAGGNSHRDYEPLIEAARRLESVNFVIATKRLADHKNLPANVTAGPLTHEDFMACMREAKAVVVPLKRDLDRSAGQQTYLNAMYFGKPTIISEAFGVKDYVKHGHNGWIVNGTSDEYVENLEYILSSENTLSIEEVCKNARDSAAQFTFDRHAQGIVDIVDEWFSEKREGVAA